MQTILLASTALLWVLMLFNLLLTIALARRINRFKAPDLGRLSTLDVGQPAPDFTAQTLQGQTVTLDDYAQRPAAFLFFSAGCQPCVEKIPLVKTLYPKAKQKGVELVLVYDGGMDEVAAFVQKHDLSVPMLVAPRGTNRFFQDYKVPGTPFHCLINDTGQVAATGFDLPNFVG